MKEIALTKGQVALVDDDDFEQLSKFKWQALWQPGRRVFVAVRSTPRPNQKTVFMTRQIMRAPAEKEVDHHDHNTLNNQRANLRVCTGSQNQGNSRQRKGCSSRFKGVCWHRDHQKWIARIRKTYKLQHLGYYADEREAARAYNQAAIEHFGEFAYLNVIEVEV